MSEPLFAPFRALGYITDSTPFAVNRRGSETWVVLSVGSSWQIYNCAKLTLTMVGPQVCAVRQSAQTSCDALHACICMRNVPVLAQGLQCAVWLARVLRSAPSCMQRCCSSVSNDLSSMLADVSHQRPHEADTSLAPCLIVRAVLTCRCQARLSRWHARAN
jgi:hypothetical protein